MSLLIGTDYDTITEAAPDAPGTLNALCSCGGWVTIVWHDRKKPESRITVRHGPGEAVLTIDQRDPGAFERWLRWVLDLDDPIGDWLTSVHDYERGKG